MTTTTATATPTGRFYDHATNLTNPAVASAVARARRELIAEGAAVTVEAAWSHDPDGFWWNGDRHTALSLAKDLVRNGAARVALTEADGRRLDAAAIAAARF